MVRKSVALTWSSPTIRPIAARSGRTSSPASPGTGFAHARMSVGTSSIMRYSPTSSDTPAAPRDVAHARKAVLERGDDGLRICLVEQHERAFARVEREAVGGNHAAKRRLRVLVDAALPRRLDRVEVAFARLSADRQHGGRVRDRLRTTGAGCSCKGEGYAQRRRCGAPRRRLVC
jgi:hypothetical protein